MTIAVDLGRKATKKQNKQNIDKLRIVLQSVCNQILVRSQSLLNLLQWSDQPLVSTAVLVKPVVHSLITAAIHFVLKLSA